MSKRTRLLARRILMPLFLLPALAGASRAAPHPEFDAFASAPPVTSATAQRARLSSEAALRGVRGVESIEERLGVPTFVWGSPAATPLGSAARVGPRAGATRAARAHLARLAPLYRLEAADLDHAVLRHVSDLGHGPIVATFRQVVDGVEVFRDELKILMNRNLELVAASGYLPGATAGASVRPQFRLTSEAAVSAALQDFGATLGAPRAIRRIEAAMGGYERFEIGSGAMAPVRVKRVLFHLPDRLVPSYYLEVIDDNDATSYVISAADGSVLFRHGLSASDAFTYRVWADAASLRLPYDGPQGTTPTPHPTGTPNNYSPPFVPTNLVTLQNGPIAGNDPWLAPGATETAGNNVDAYADLFTPDGLTAGDFRATTTSAATFDRTYDPNLSPTASANQQLASITQLFYTTNFLHDWFYDSGFDEASGNAQALNYGRGGVEGDRLRAEAQDYSGTNNANMMTPSDGAAPRMQMYIFIPPAGAKLAVNSPPIIAGDYAAVSAGGAVSTFNLTGNATTVNDGVGTTGDGCEAIVNAIGGKIALLEFGGCTNQVKCLNAQNAGAIGILLLHNVPGAAPPTTNVGGTITIPVLVVSYEAGVAIKAQLGGGPVSVTMVRGNQLSRDGSLDNQIVAHEWGHYISNRLIGDANGLTTQQSGGLGEGWGDFHSMLLTVRPEDALVAGNDDFDAVYGMAGYALSRSLAPNNAYYFGIRRYPYSTDMSKNPLTFRHIENDVPLPVGPPVAFGASGASNAEVHNTGEVWTTMLWECYASLLRDTGRLTFDQARDRMRTYLVGAYKMTPNAPTLTEARDALLSVASASDATDFGLFCAAFAKRGAGIGARSPDRFSTTNEGVVESFVCGGDLAFVSASLSDDVANCDDDGYVDNGETGALHIALRNAGSIPLSGTTATVSSTNPAVTFPNGNGVAFPSSAPFTTHETTIAVSVNGATGVQGLDFQIQYDDPDRVTNDPLVATFDAYGNADETPSALETVETASPPWTISGTGADDPWHRISVTPTVHRFFAHDPGGLADQMLTTPPLQVSASGDLILQFSHAYSFEQSGGAFYDGGVIEISDNAGATWADVAGFGAPGYSGTIFVGADNPLSGRTAYAGESAGYPALQPVSVNLGPSWAGKTVLLRFRLGADEAVDAPGWTLDDITVTNLVNQPFFALIAEADPCTPLAVDDDRPTRWSFAMAGANPVTGEARFGFALPEPARVEVAIYDVGGRRVATIADAEYAPGRHVASWNPGSGSAAHAGVYFARMTANRVTFTRRIVVTH